MQPIITRASWAMIIALGFVWGGTFLVMELALRGITPIWLAFARLGFAALLLTTVWQWRGELWLSEDRPWHMLLLAGLLSAALPFMLLSWGLQYVTSGFAGVSMAAIPLIVLPLAHFFLVGERMSLRRSIGFVTGFAGVFILIGGPSVFEASGADGETWGRLACVSAAVCYGVNSIITRRLPPIDPVGLAASLMLIGGAILLPLALWKEGVPHSISLETFGYLALLGLVPTAAANLLRVLVIRSAGSTFMSLTNYMVPVWSIFLGAWILDEELPDGMLTALALILGGVLVSQLGALRRMFSR